MMYITDAEERQQRELMAELDAIGDPELLPAAARTKRYWPRESSDA